MTGALAHREGPAADLDFVETDPSEAEKAETAIAATNLFQPVLKALHRLAQDEEPARRYGLS